MTNGIGNQVLLHTKLRRPRVTADLIPRPRLNKSLNDNLNHPLILVAAPAGFGKSTLVSVWLETSHLSHTWVSLDESDNDLGIFLAYLLEAIQTLFPDTVPETKAFLASISLPTVAVIANSLINELDRVGRDFILVLDDYHVIHAEPIHELLNLLLQHPPQGMHLVIVTRRDPPLPLGLLRARDQVAEIRGQDLRFSRSEVAEFVEKALGLTLADDALTMLAETTEGWAAGLRLTALTLRTNEDVGTHLAGLHAENRYVLDYLMSEVLSNVPPSMRDFLLKTSILDQVCASLGEALIGPDDPACKPQEWLVWLEQANMFTVALDSRGEWYRYHHLFQDLLRDQLAHQVSANEIATLHTRASAWYGRHHSLEEALRHALLGDDIVTAVHLVAEHRHALMDAEQWQLHERIFHMFPAETVAEHPDLILMAAWMARLGRFDLAHVLELVSQAESLLVHMPNQPEHAVHLKGESDTLRIIVAGDAVTDPEKIIMLARQALATTPRTWYYVRSTAWLYLAVASQMVGRLDQAFAALAEGQPEDMAQNGTMHARVAGSRCFIEWMAGDLQGISQGAAYFRAVSETHHRRESLGWAHYFLSSVAYQHNDLTTAETHAKTLENLRYVSRPMTYLQSAFIYALIYQAQDQPDLAQRKLAQAFDYLRETHSEGLAPLAQAFQAELAVMQGDVAAARHWAATIAPFLPPTLMPYFFAPQMTLPKILLAQDTLHSRQQATTVLSRLHDFVTATHNTRFTIEVLALQALLHNAEGNEQAALVLLQQALLLAEPGGFIRLFLDLGPRLVSLLTRLRQTDILPDYTSQILQAFGESTSAVPHTHLAISSMGQTELGEPLTEREREILALLAQRLTDKEIAQTLVISPMTVKRHAATIYQKLQVSGRREAVTEAIRLGLL